MKKIYFIGIDVSKRTIDVSFIMQTSKQKTQPCWKIFTNNEQGLHQMKIWLQSNHVPFNKDTLFVIENTGLYYRLLVEFCNKHQLQLCIENGAQVNGALVLPEEKVIRLTAAALRCMQCALQTA